MATDNKTGATSPPDATPSQIVSLVDSMRQLVEDGKAGRQQKLHETLVVTPFDPQGSIGGRRKVKLKYSAVYMNGARLNPVLMHDEEIGLVNQIKKPGLYNKRKWEVVRQNDSLEIHYKNRTFEQRMELKGDAPTFAAMCRVILAEQEERELKRRRGEPIDEFDD